MTFVLDREKLLDEYQLNLPIFEKLMEEAVHDIKHALKGGQFKIHSVTSRIKDFKSICDKSESGEFNEPLKQVVDIVGTRVVALFLGDIDRIVEALSSAFEVVEIDNKLTKKEPAEFGYLSVHLLVKFKPHFFGTRYNEIKEKVFEIQVRTIAMDAWASASHYLDYKSEDDVPSDLKRDFQALSGLFYVADKHFEMFFRSRQAAVKEVQKLSKDNNLLHEEINFDTLAEYLLKKYPKRESAMTNQISILVTSLREAGIQTLDKLDVYLNKKETYLDRLESGRKDGRFNRVGAVRISFADDASFEPHVMRAELNPVETQPKKL